MMSYKQWLMDSNSGAEWRDAFNLCDKMSGAAKAVAVMAMFRASQKAYYEYVRNHNEGTNT